MWLVFTRTILLFLLASIGLGLSSCSRNSEQTSSDLIIINAESPQLENLETDFQSRLIVYTTSQIAKHILVKKMQDSTTNCKINHLRVLSTGGHVLTINCTSEAEYTKSLNSFNELSIIKQIEIDRIMTIGN